MVSNFSLTIVLLFFCVTNGYTSKLSNSTSNRGDRRLSQKHGTKVEVQAGNATEISAERRASYNSIRDRRNYYKREDPARQKRRQQSRRHDDRDLLEPQESSHPLPKQSVIQFDKALYEFGLKLPKRVSTKLTPVDEWATTALPQDVENLVMPPNRPYNQKMPRLISFPVNQTSLSAVPLPLSMPEQLYPTRIQINENNKRILSEMNKEMLMTSTTSQSSTDQPLHTSTPSTAQPQISLLSPNASALTSDNATQDQPLTSESTARNPLEENSSPKDERTQETPTKNSIIPSNAPQSKIMVDYPDRNQGRAFPTGFNDFYDVRTMVETTSQVLQSDLSPSTSMSPDRGRNASEEEEREVDDISPETTEVDEPSVAPTTKSPPFIKVYLTSAPTEPTFFSNFDPGNGSDAGIIVSIVDDPTLSAQSVGLAIYVLAIFGLVPVVLAFVFVTKCIINRKNRKNDCESDASSMDVQPPGSSRMRGAELRKSPSSATTITLVHATRLPRVPQKCHTWELQRHQLKLISILGHGNFGQVWKAELHDGSGTTPRLVAVKSIKEGASEKEQEEIIKELQIMQHAGHHPNVVHLIGCCTEKDPYFLVMEYIPNGKLLTYLREHRTKGTYYNFSRDSQALTSRDLTVFMYCMARGMEYLASKRIIHRDLAARNILVDQHKMCKIADFGMSRILLDGGDEELYEERQHRGALPIRWMAPESLHYSVFTHKSDVWSFGILMWETITLGSTPYPNLGAREVVEGVRNGLRLEKPAHVKNELFHLISRCWSEDPNLRPSFTELRQLISNRLDGSFVDLDSYALDNRFHLQTRSRNRRSKNTGKGTVTLVGNGSFTVNSMILDKQFSIV